MDFCAELLSRFSKLFKPLLQPVYTWIGCTV